MVKLALQADPTGFALTPRLKYWVPQNPFNRSQQQNVLLLQKASAYPKLSEILIGPMSISGGRTSLPTLVNALCPRLADLLVPRVGYRRSNSPDLGPVQSSLLPSYPCLSQKSKQPVPRRDPRRSIFDRVLRLGQVANMLDRFARTRMKLRKTEQPMCC